ncbi:MAG: potassium channel family protein [Pseudanabaenaceae cyanobacterium]
MASNLQDLARQGDPQAIANLMQKALDSKKIQVTALRQDHCLHLLFESKTVPDSEAMIAFVCQGMTKIGLDTSLYLRVYGYELGTPFPLWLEQLVYRAEDRAWLRGSSDRGRGSFGQLVAGLECDPQTNTQLTTPEFRCDRFIVCGLGGLGQNCVVDLKKFAYEHYGVEVVAIDRVKPENPEVEGLFDLLAEPVILGDCRRSEVLESAGIHQARAILFVTSDETANIEGAIAARRLNPGIRIVVRSSQTNLNQLLKDQLGGFVALDPIELPAAAYAVAGIASDTYGLFDIGEQSLRVVERKLPTDTPVSSLNKSNSRLISVPDLDPQRLFWQWAPDQQLKRGDRCAFLELISKENTPSRKSKRRSFLANWWYQLRNLTLAEFWQWIQADQARQAVFIGIILGFVLWLANTIVLYTNVPNLPFHRAAASAVVLLLGGYGDVFPGIDDPSKEIPDWIEIFCLFTTIVSILYVVGVLGIIADSVISSKFAFLQQGVAIPEQDHVVLVGYGRLGKKVARLLYRLQQPMVIFTTQTGDVSPPPDTPLFHGATPQDLDKGNLQTARSVVAVTDNQMFNLEVTLYAKNTARQYQRNLDLVIRTQDQFFSDNLEELLPKAKALSIYTLSSGAFAGAAFGEDMLSVFRLYNQTVLAAEYEITPGDTLTGKNLAQIAYGYEVVPVYLRTLMPRPSGEQEFFLPSDDELLSEGDRLIVLSSIAGLRRIEQGEMRCPRKWQLYAQSPLSPTTNLEIGNRLSQITGCELETARHFVENLPCSLELELYDQQAYRLGHTLSKMLPIKLLPLHS